MKNLEQTIDEVLRHFNARQSFFGRGMIPEQYLPGLRSMLILAIQRSLTEAFNAFEEPTNREVTSNDLETLQEAYDVIKVLLRKHTIGASTTINEDERWMVEDKFLVIEPPVAGVTRIFLTDQPPADEPAD